MRRLMVQAERWPVRGSFTISRGSVDSVEVVTVSLAEGEPSVAVSAAPIPAMGRVRRAPSPPSRASAR